MILKMGPRLVKKNQLIEGDGYHEGGVHGLVPRRVRLHLPGGRLCIEIRVLQTHQVEVLFKSFPLFLICFSSKGLQKHVT